MQFLQVEDLTKKFGGITAVNRASFKISKGEIVGLIGPNGSGKTTLLRLITGILKPDEGRVLFKGEDITGRRPWHIVEKGIAGTFQVAKPFRRLPCIVNVLVAALSPRASKRGSWIKKAEVRARDALEFVGLADFAMERATVLSQGDLIRLEIARAIATEPELLLLDEPFGGLNPGEMDLLSGSLKRLHKGGRFGRLHSEGPTIFIIEHKLPELLKLVNRVVVINFGQIIAEGSPEEIAKDEKVIEAYIGKEEGDIVP